MSRGTLAPDDYRAWKAENHPGTEGKDWLAYEAWRAKQAKGVSSG
jgi:hypothetical protein